MREAGGEAGEIDLAADALVWLDAADLDELTRALAAAPAARWVQLPFAGVELVAGAGLLDPARTWTCAKGAYAEPVAEHALMLALAGLRLLRRRIGAWSWGMAARESLYDQPVTIVSGGGIAARLLELLAPMRLRNNREAIAERPSVNGQFASLSNFGTMTFTQAWPTGTASTPTTRRVSGTGCTW